ncbi:alpha-hydroxy-acid oxidizing enzyme [Brevirhabdus pacifica]|uniref:Alpha-hydroxy-acid oxidizing enzyme n=1 Tax=Brevirhabdus pacifica TaxID=1267768 RepID=A0A1U7DKU9_9RHOB|nr:alpha-hydroxy acid oxidase [Brevirhabdus pacifica]APX90545.1 alpha-hydroxy-acid oxidizing enzyme [Brevirhabdus pacifica]PJJ85329.1 L-lactate dehydrogenase (cytochrome) [Brevirhabdus pacifica]
MDLDLDYPAISDLRRRAKRRIPHFAWEYLDSATGEETTKSRNEEDLDRVLLTPAILRGEVAPDLRTTLLGRDYPLPFGVAPVGMSGMIWPGAEMILAALARDLGIPYGLSTVACHLPDTVKPHIGDQGWFQLYPTRDTDVRRDILRRARECGFHTLVVTADIPAPARRERQRRAHLNQPMKISPSILAQVAMRPAWALGTLRHGRPRLRLMEDYARFLAERPEGSLDSTKHMGYLLRTAPDWDYLAETLGEWDGPVIVKGVMEPADALRLRDMGVAAAWVSNHSGRQFDASPSSVSVLPAVRAAVGPDYPLIFDSGIRSGLDIVRAIALGADFVMLGRAFHYGLGAFGAKGAAHAAHILTEDIISTLGQIGVARPVEARDRLAHVGAFPPMAAPVAGATRGPVPRPAPKTA